MIASRKNVEGTARRTRQAAIVCLSLFTIVLGCGIDNGPGSEFEMSTAPEPCGVALTPHRGGHKAMDERIQKLQGRAAQSAEPARIIEQLGWLYVAKARSTNDAGFWRLAGETADCVDTKSPGSASALLLKGHVLHNLHRFQEAEVVARQLVARRQAPFDFGLLGDALMEQGRLDEAADAYQKMMDLKPSLHSYSRASHLRWLKGDLEGAIEAMEMAARAASPRDPGAAAWVYTRLANQRLQAGEPDGAMAAATMALALQPDYAAALAAKGRALMAKNEMEEAIETLERAVTLSPVPESLWVLADALRESGRIEEATRWERQLERDGAAEDPRTFSLYLATRGLAEDQSVELAQREMENRADVFTHDALAWALYRNGRPNQAAEAMELALREQTEDARLFLHAGVIAAARGNRKEASGWLRRAEAFEQTLLPSERKHLVALSASLRASPPSL